MKGYLALSSAITLTFSSLLGAIAVGITGIGVFTDVSQMGGDAEKMCIRDRGWAVRPLKRYVSWVQNVVRQFGPYPL